MKFRIKNRAPKRAARILVMGPPGSNRSRISRLLAKKYGFVHISTRALVSDQIARKTEVGRNCLMKLNEGKLGKELQVGVDVISLVEDDIIIGLVHNRTNKTDCLTHGFVLDGFPKNVEQTSMIEHMQIKPSFIVVLQLDEERIIRRI